MRRIFGCLRINSIIPRIPVRIISTPLQQSDCTLAASLVSYQHRTDGTTHVTRQIDGDSGWGGGVRLASGRAAAAAASKATKPRASDTTGRAWPVYLTLNCAHCWPMAGMHLLKLQTAVQVDRLVVSWAV